MTGGRWTAAAAVAVVATLLAGGCGYGLVGRTSSLPEDISNIHVSPLVNRTTRSQVDQLLTQAIATEFVKRRRFELVSGRGEADAVLSGAVTSYNERPVTFGSDGRATEFEIQITADVEFGRPGADEPIWSRQGYLFRELYEVELSAAGYFDRDDRAIEEVAEKFAETLIIDLLEGF